MGKCVAEPLHAGTSSSAILPGCLFSQPQLFCMHTIGLLIHTAFPLGCHFVPSCLGCPFFLIKINRNKNNPLISLLELRVRGTNQCSWCHWLFCRNQSWYLFSLAVNCTLKTNSFVLSFLFLIRLKQNTFILTMNISQDLGKISKVIKSTVCVVSCCSCT